MCRCRFLWFIKIHEADLSHQPVLALHYNIERSETITILMNELIGIDSSELSPALARLMAEEGKEGAISPKWDGKAAERIVENLERVLANK